jgi:heme-degrading monooxygenase HmoA
VDHRAQESKALSEVWRNANGKILQRFALLRKSKNNAQREPLVLLSKWEEGAAFNDKEGDLSHQEEQLVEKGRCRYLEKHTTRKLRCLQGREASKKIFTQCHSSCDDRRGLPEKSESFANSE